MQDDRTTFLAAARQPALTGTQDEATPWWARHSRDEVARHALSVRFNTRHIEALRRMADPENGLSMAKVTRRAIVPVIEAFIKEQASKKDSDKAV